MGYPLSGRIGNEHNTKIKEWEGLLTAGRERAQSHEN